jgi:hypothetical protein
MRQTRFAMACAAGLLIVLVGAASGALAQAARSLKWEELVPAGPPKPLKPFFGSRPADAPRGPDAPAEPPPSEDRAWMSGPAQQNSTPAPVVTALDGERVQIGGYVVPLDFDATKVKEFLLVPFVGACIHVPPPPANQIIYVKPAQPFEIKATFDPVYVTGKISVAPTFTGLAETGYTIDAEKVELRK